jgi:hypothetical protein
MRILETIAQTLRSARAHPTTVLNALIELENAGGSAALYELEYRLARLVRAMRERDAGLLRNPCANARDCSSPDWDSRSGAECSQRLAAAPTASADAISLKEYGRCPITPARTSAQSVTGVA